MEIDIKRIEDAIIIQTSEFMMSNEDLEERIANKFDARIEKLWLNVAEPRIRASIQTAITDGFEREYTKLDSFGKQHGEKTTIRAELEKQIVGYWNEMVDKRGVPSSGYGEKMTRADWMMTKLVAADFQGEMKRHVVNVTGGIKDGLRKELHETINRMLSDVFKVKSIDDKAGGAI